MSSIRSVESDSLDKPTGKKVNEFTDGRETPSYTWKQSFGDWIRQSFKSRYNDVRVEHELLSMLPFYPNSDGKRTAKIIDTDIGDGNYIHELYIENTDKTEGILTYNNSDAVRDVVLIHGYAASLGLFIENFNDLSSIPGIKIHAIDLLGFGFSSRPKFPNFKSDTKEDIYKTEDWFIDSLETWRKKRNLDRFILMGHSFGGYLSCAYALKYNKNILEAGGKSCGIIDKLVLISPVGLERSKFSLLKDISGNGAISDSERNIENQGNPQITLSREITANQESIVHGEDIPQTEIEDEPPKSKGRKLLEVMWKRNYSPFSVIRNAGPAKSKFISRWTTHRFAHIYAKDPEQFQHMHDYIYRIFNGKGSGEYAITRVLAVGALAKLPLLDRCPEKFAKMNLPTLWMYGDKDWMNEEAGFEMATEINLLSNKSIGLPLASFKIIPSAGHHLYLDNPAVFAAEIFKFLGFRR